MDKHYWAALQMVSGLGNARINSLVVFFGSARQVWQASRRDLFLSGCLPEDLCNNIIECREKIDAEQLSVEWGRLGVHIVTLADPEYPVLLKRIFDPPAVLYYRGRLPADDRLVAVVGARRATAYGKNAAAFLAGDLAASGFGVVSGAARGIDSAAHKGALDREGYTIAVLGCGVDVVYPPENGRLLAAIAEKGAVISEYRPGTSPQAQFFPVRNRIISGLSRGVVVVEAAAKSRSLITADMALEQGRDVFAVPGSIFSAASRGSHRLLKQGAKLVEAVGDVLEEYDFTAAAKDSRRPPRPDGDEGRLYAALSYETPLSIEEIVLKAKLPTPVVTYLLLQLELKGLVAEFGGRRFALAPGREWIE